MDFAANIVVLAGLLIGLAYGAVGLLSGFCLMSSLRGWWAQGDSRLIRAYALALGVAIFVAQLLAARGVVDLGKTIYLQPSFSAPLMAEAASMRAMVSLRPNFDSSAGTDVTPGVICEACSSTIREGAIRPFNVICAKIARIMTTTSERRLPRPSSTSAREPQPFDITMP